MSGETRLGREVGIQQGGHANQHHIPTGVNEHDSRTRDFFVAPFGNFHGNW